MAQGVPSYKGAVSVGVHATSMTDLRQALPARTVSCRFHDWETTHDDGAEFDPTSGMADPEDVAEGDYDVRGRGTLEGTVEGVVPYLTRSLMGGQPSSSVVGVTGHQHVWSIADAIPLNGGRLAVEVKTGASQEAEEYAAVCGSLEFQLNQAGYARWATELLGSSPALNAAPTVPAYPSVNSLLKKRVTTVTFDGATALVVRNLSWRVQRDLDEDDYDVTSNQRRDTAYGEVHTTFDAELTFQNEDQRRDYWGGNDSPSPDAAYYPVNIKTEGLTIAGGTAKYTAMLDMPKVKITGVSKPMRGRNVIRQRLTGRAVYSPGSGYAQRVTFINSVVGY